MTAVPKSKFQLALKIATKGARFDAEPGETKSISWRGQETPRTVVQARAGEAIDWGGCMVQARDYAVTLDQPAQ
jgi:hypothetical protein